MRPTASRLNGRPADRPTIPARTAADEADATRLAPAPEPDEVPEDDQTRLQPSDIAPEQPASGPGSGEQTNAARAQPADDGLGIGSILRGRFRIESVLGEGGMGTVFGAVDLLKQEARDEQVHVALKVMKPDIVDAEMTFRGLQREARRAQQLAHPNIVTVYDFDRADGHIYMTMEYLRGQPVSVCSNRTGTGWSLTWRATSPCRSAPGLHTPTPRASCTSI